MSHFLFIAGALRERSSQASAELQLAHELWGIRTGLIRDNLTAYVTPQSCGLVYVLKAGICAGFTLASGVLSVADLSEFVRDELRAETAFGFVKVGAIQTWPASTEESLTVLRRVLDVSDPAELTRRLNLGMHRLTQEQYDAILCGLRRG
jgi:hypothetical protein